LLKTTPILSGCHQTIFLERYDMLANAAENAVFFAEFAGAGRTGLGVATR